ncbi:MAG: hypothetical protein HC773_31070 [Scytonema sp. CRU_2_7]|nr:hypothetical protein [Scytonema sp. CRU_2_7]
MCSFGRCGFPCFRFAQMPSDQAIRQSEQFIWSPPYRVSVSLLAASGKNIKQ